VGNYYYGQGHPMKPHRIRMTHSLLLHYGVHQEMEIFKPFPARDKDMCRFHSEDYVEFLRNVTPENQLDMVRLLKRFNVGEDCPVSMPCFTPLAWDSLPNDAAGPLPQEHSMPLAFPRGLRDGTRHGLTRRWHDPSRLRRCSTACTSSAKRTRGGPWEAR